MAKEKRKRKRSIVFISICILSMLGGALGVFIGIISLIDIDLLSIISRIPGYTSIKSLTFGSSSIYPYLKVLLYGFSFTGVLMMFLLKRQGFIIYSIAQIILLIIPYFVWNLKPIVVFFTDLPDMIFTFAFIAAYWIYLPNIKAQDSTESEISEGIGKVK